MFVYDPKMNCNNCNTATETEISLCLILKSTKPCSTTCKEVVCLFVGRNAAAVPLHRERERHTAKLNSQVGTPKCAIRNT